MAPGQRRIITTLALAALFALAAPAHAQSDEAKTRAQLKQLEQDIARIQVELGSAGTERDKLQEELRSAEVQLGKLLRDIKRSERDIDSGERELQELKAEQARLTTARDEQRERIKLELNAAWRSGREGQLLGHLRTPRFGLGAVASKQIICTSRPEKSLLVYVCGVMITSSEFEAANVTIFFFFGEVRRKNWLPLTSRFSPLLSSRNKQYHTDKSDTEMQQQNIFGSQPAVFLGGGLLCEAANLADSI